MRTRYIICEMGLGELQRLFYELVLVDRRGQYGINFANGGGGGARGGYRNLRACEGRGKVSGYVVGCKGESVLHVWAYGG